jgi:hypothetical protein
VSGFVGVLKYTYTITHSEVMHLFENYTLASRVRGRQYGHSHTTGYCTGYGASSNVDSKFWECRFSLFIFNIIFLQVRGSFESIFIPFT